MGGYIYLFEQILKIGDENLDDYTATIGSNISIHFWKMKRGGPAIKFHYAKNF